MVDDLGGLMGSVVGAGITLAVASRVVDMIPRPRRTRVVVKYIKKRIHHKRR